MTIDYEAEISKRDQQIAELLERIQKLEEEIKRLKKLLADKAASKKSKKPKFSLNYSVDKNSLQHQRGKKATGRQPQEKKLGLVNTTETVYPPNSEAAACVIHRQQYAWRIIDGQAQYVCYEIYGEPDCRELPAVPGLRNSRSEYGLEIILVLAFLHYWIGLSIDHACEVLQFFTGLELSKSQANALLNQLSQDWTEEYDTIAQLLAIALVIYIDETGWKVGKQNCYTWAFSTAMHVLFRCGVSRSKQEAQEILGEKFAGIGVSDDYKAYEQLFEEHQLCWAHLLRKAIKLMLENPDQAEYEKFFKELLAIYQQAVSYQKDQRLSTGRCQKAEQLQAQIVKLCSRAGEAIDKETTSVPEATFIRLQNELVNHLDSLFVFVEHPEVEPTNNRSEGNVRREAEIRKGGRTSKTEQGAKRRSIIMTVLASLNTRFKKFTLNDLLAEVKSWMEMGCSIFKLELSRLEQANAPPVT